MEAWKDLVERIQQSQGRGHDPLRRQVRRVRGLLQEHQRSALPRRFPSPAQGEASSRSRPRRSSSRTGCDLLDDADGILVAGRASAIAARRGMMTAAEYRARRTASPISASATASSGRWSSSRATSAGLDGRRFDRGRRAETPHKVIYKLRDLLGVDDLGGTMRLGSYACRLTPDSLSFRLYGEESSTSGIATGTSSTACTSRRSPTRACASSADRSTASSWRSWNCRATRGSSPCSSIRSSSRNRCARIRCSPASSRRPTSASAPSKACRRTSRRLGTGEEDRAPETRAPGT